MHDERTRESDALPHAARELARVGGLETVEPDHVDRGERTLADLGLGQPLRLEAERHVLEHREPWKDREALEHHRDAASGARNRLAAIA